MGGHFAGLVLTVERGIKLATRDPILLLRKCLVLVALGLAVYSYWLMVGPFPTPGRETGIPTQDIADCYPYEWHRSALPTNVYIKGDPTTIYCRSDYFVVFEGLDVFEKDKNGLVRFTLVTQDCHVHGIGEAHAYAGYSLFTIDLPLTRPCLPVRIKADYFSEQSGGTKLDFYVLSKETYLLCGADYSHSWF